MNLSPLLKLFNQIPAYNTLADALHSEKLEKVSSPLGVLTAARPALLAALSTDLRRPVLFITARADRARVLTEQIQAWVDYPANVYRLPDPDSLPHEKVAWGSETIQGRLTALSALVAYKNNQQSMVNSQSSTAAQPPPPGPPPPRMLL
jgi:transcription-repair coupling factor (superfamily II helicase)